MDALHTLVQPIPIVFDHKDGERGFRSRGRIRDLQIETDGFSHLAQASCDDQTCVKVPADAGNFLRVEARKECLGMTVDFSGTDHGKTLLSHAGSEGFLQLLPEAFRGLGDIDLKGQDCYNLFFFRMG